MTFPHRAILALIALTVAALPGGVRAGGSSGAGVTGPTSLSPGWRSVLTVPAGQQLSGLAIDLRGAVSLGKWAYTADITTGHIVKFGTSGRKILSWSYGKPAPAGTPIGLAVGGSGNVFVADPGTDTVTKFSPSGRLLTRWAGFSLPVSVAVDRAGRVFVAEQDARRVTELSPSGKVLDRWTPSAIYSPGGGEQPNRCCRGASGSNVDVDVVRHGYHLRGRNRYRHRDIPGPHRRVAGIFRQWVAARAALGDAFRVTAYHDRAHAASR